MIGKIRSQRDSCIHFCLIMSLVLYISLYHVLYVETYVATNVVWCHKSNFDTHLQDTHLQGKLCVQLPPTYQNTEISKSPDGNHSFVDMPALCQMKQIKDRNKNRIIIGHLNINSVRNKFDEFTILSSGNIDIICDSETKLDSSFPVKQFTMEGDSQPYRRDNTEKVEGYLYMSKMEYNLSP